MTVRKVAISITCFILLLGVSIVTIFVTVNPDKEDLETTQHYTSTQKRWSRNTAAQIRKIASDDLANGTLPNSLVDQMEFITKDSLKPKISTHGRLSRSTAAHIRQITPYDLAETTLPNSLVDQLGFKPMKADIQFERALITGKTHYVEDSGLTASSVCCDHAAHAAWCSRLKDIPSHPCIPGWAPVLENGSWIQADFGQIFHITRVETRGRFNEHSNYVSKFSISIQNDTGMFDTEEGMLKMFKGNCDTTQIKVNYIVPSLIGRYVRLYVLEWHQYPVLQWEIYGYQ